MHATSPSFSKGAAVEDMQQSPENTVVEEKNPVMIAKAVGSAVMLIVAIGLLFFAWTRMQIMLEENRIVTEHVDTQQYDKAYFAYVALAERTSGSTRERIENQAAIAAANHVNGRNIAFNETASWYYRAWVLDPEVLDEQAMTYVDVFRKRLEAGTVEDPTKNASSE